MVGFSCARLAQAHAVAICLQSLRRCRPEPQHGTIDRGVAKWLHVIDRQQDHDRSRLRRKTAATRPAGGRWGQGSDHSPFRIAAFSQALFHRSGSSAQRRFHGPMTSKHTSRNSDPSRNVFVEYDLPVAVAAPCEELEQMVTVPTSGA